MRLITLLTDFGLGDASVAIAKSILLSYNPQCPVLDISHQASGKFMVESAYLLLSSYNEFPMGSCHVVYVGIYHSESPSLILGEKNGHFFLAPNNGILPLALGIEGLTLWQCYEWNSQEKTFKDWQQKCASIIQGLNNNSPEELGLSSFNLDNIRQIHFPIPIINGDSIDCQILHINHYGNVVVNIQKQYFEDLRANRKFQIDLNGAGHIQKESKHLGNVGDTDAIMRFNKSGFLEISVKNGNASKLFGLNKYSGDHKFYTHIKINFG